MRFFTNLFIILISVIGRSHSQYSQRRCTLNNQPISCNDPNYLMVSSGSNYVSSFSSGGTQYSSSSGRTCFMNNMQIPCNSYDSIMSGQTQYNGVPYPYRNSNQDSWDSIPIPVPNYPFTGNNQQFTNSPSPSQVNSLGFRRQSGRDMSGRSCFLDNEIVDCNDPIYRLVEQEGGNVVYESDGRDCTVNGKLLSCNSPLFDKMFGRSRTYIEDEPTPAPRIIPRRPITPQPLPPIEEPVLVIKQPNIGYPIPVKPERKCGQVRNPNVDSLMIKGKNVNKGELPWHVAIYQISKKNELICGGSIVSPYAILTAAHCFYEEEIESITNATEFIVMTGKMTRNFHKIDSKSTRRYEVERILMQGFYASTTNFANDIVILQLKIGITFSPFVNAVCLYSEDHIIPPNSMLTVGGWGRNEEDVHSEILKSATFNYVTQNDCAQQLPSEIRAAVSADKFCIRHTNETELKDGDSGGGLTYRENRNSPYYLVGIVSVRSTVEKAKFTIITDVNKFWKWIQDGLEEILTAKRQKNY